MNLNEYSSEHGEPYHFESSECYCDSVKSLCAAADVQQQLEPSADDRVQLYAFLALELLRYELAHASLELSLYQKKVQEVVSICDAQCGRSPFDPTKVHDSFYNNLNKYYE